MTTCSTMDTEGCIEQCIRIIDAGADLVRLTTQGTREAENLRNIKAGLVARGYGDTPLCADVHFNPNVADVAATIVEKVRINPGNYVDPARQFKHLEYTDEEYRQDGSLSDRIMSRYGDTPAGIVESCMEFLRICEREHFPDVVVSIKASNTVIMVESVRLLCKEMEKEGMDYPLHLGVTEAGEGEDGRLKSAVGIGALLIDGIGDTIRVSLSEEPECEIPVAQSILQAARVQMCKPEFISCPGCGRTLYDLQDTIRRIKAAIEEKAKADARYRTLKIGIMGCIVNGPGEMADADYGYVGAARGKVSLYKNKECVERNVPEAEAVEHLIAFIDKDLAPL